MRIRKKKRIFTLFLSLVLITVPLSLYFISANPKTKDNIFSPIQIEKENQIKKIAEEENLLNGQYAIVVKNLKTGESFYYNEIKKFQSASLYKLWVLAVAMNSINEGRLSESETVTGDLELLNEALEIPTPTPVEEENENNEGEEGGDEEIKKEPLLISFRVDDALEKMITVSDNYAALLLSSRVGNTNVANFLKNERFSGSSYDSPPITTASDVAIFFEKLYKGEFVSSSRMLDILKRQTFNDRIPKYLPENTKVAHKTGELGKFKHDAGIVYGTKGEYLMVVLSETANPIDASERIANFSKKIFEHMEK